VSGRVRVHPAELSGYAKQLERNGDSAIDMWRYADGYMDFSALSTGGLINLVLEGHKHAYSAGRSICQYTHTLLHASSQELTKAAHWYRSTDEAAAERIDHLNVGVPRPPGRQPGDLTGRAHGRYTDLADPRHGLNGATSLDLTDPSQPISTVLDLISPAAWAFGLVEAITGRNIPGEVAQEFVGDWEAWSKAGSVWEQLGQAFAELGHNVAQGNADMDPGWDGVAADAAYEYFGGLADDLGAQQETFNALHSGYEFYARFSYTVAAVISDLIKSLFDILLELTASGGAAGEVIAALQTPRIIHICDKISKLISAAKTAGGAVNAFIIFHSEMLISLRRPLPQHAYDLNGV